MSRNLVFRVEISFADKVTTDEEIMEVANNIAEALRHEANTGGLAPEDSDTYTEYIRVTPQYLNETIIINI